VFILSVIIVIAVFGVTYGTELRWLNHAVAGVINLLFAVAVVLLGAMNAGRKKSMRRGTLVRTHKRLGIYLSLLVAGTFLLGVWSRNAHGEALFWQSNEPMAAFVHGWLSVIILIIGFSQVIPRLVVKDLRKTRKLHLIIGYALLILLIIQTVLGIQLIMLETGQAEFLAFSINAL
jgi:cytochrome b561